MRTADACTTSGFSEIKANPVLRISSEQTLGDITLVLLDFRLSKSAWVCLICWENVNFPRLNQFLSSESLLQLEQSRLTEFLWNTMSWTRMIFYDNLLLYALSSCVMLIDFTTSTDASVLGEDGCFFPPLSDPFIKTWGQLSSSRHFPFPFRWTVSVFRRESLIVLCPYCIDLSLKSKYVGLRSFLEVLVPVSPG